MRVSLQALEELRAKYQQMLAMRLAHASGTEDAADVRDRMARLAARFPGVLREMDDLELEEIQRRINVLDAVLSKEREVEPWMEAVALFHAMTRGVLAAKRWLAGRKDVDVEIADSYRAEVATFVFPEDARAWTDHLDFIASPPSGRLTDLVFVRLARELGTTEAGARELVFGALRRTGRKR